MKNPSLKLVLNEPSISSDLKLLFCFATKKKDLN